MSHQVCECAYTQSLRRIYVILHNLVEAITDLFRYPELGDKADTPELCPYVSYFDLQPSISPYRQFSQAVNSTNP